MELEQMKRALDIETIKLTRRRAKRKSVKAKKAMLLDENWYLRGSISIFEARVDSSFTDGYFTASYEVVKALLPHLDLQAAFN